MSSAAFLIYSGIMPLLKMYANLLYLNLLSAHALAHTSYITIFFGFLLARKGFFPLAAARGASQISMNVSLPSLIFANVVPALTPSNISAIGPLMLLAHTYQAIGFGLALLIREIFYVPRNFWQGILVLGAMSNWCALHLYGDSGSSYA
jgi:predicted permease